jgi:hypothetical protein
VRKIGKNKKGKMSGERGKCEEMKVWRNKEEVKSRRK